MEHSMDIKAPLLSISLLVSNRIDTIRKCMESLRPLMEAVPAELIAVDTGGTDGSIEVVKEFTENIVPFTWCDDFAAARNAGLKKARGEWFLFLDDDEWFEDTREIKDFFLTGEYMNYMSAQYQVRNYSADGGSADAYVSRMCKLSPEIHFTGSIHEHLTPISGPTKYFDAFVHHYGYCYQTEEERQSHFDRNVTLLKKELHKDPTNVRYLCQLAQEYETVRDFKNEEAICRLALNNTQLSGVSITGMNWLMAALVRILSAQGKTKDALKEGKRLLEKKQPYELTRAVILAHITEDSLTVKEYRDAIDYAMEYINLISILEDNPEMASVQSMLTMTFSYVKNLYGIIMANGLEACCGAEDFNSAEPFLSWLFDPEKNPEIEQACVLAERIKEKYPEAVQGLTSAMACLPNSEELPYLLLQELLADNETNRYELQGKYDRCVERCLEKQMFSKELLSVAGRKCLNHTVMLEKMDRNEWEDWLSALLTDLPVQEMRGLQKGLSASSDRSLKYLSFAATLDRLLLIKETESIKEESKEINSASGYSSYCEALYGYCREGLAYFRGLYREEVFKKEGGINLPKECRFLLYLEDAFQLEKGGDISGCLAAFRKAIHSNRNMAGTVALYMDLLEEKPGDYRQTEFYQLGESVKNEARMLIDRKEYAAAVSILSQLETLLPYDTEIHQLIKQAAENP